MKVIERLLITGLITKAMTRINILKKLIILSLLVVSCKNNIKKNHYHDGSLKAEFQINTNGIKNGFYKEFYKSGELKASTNYSNGVIEDTVLHYYKNGTIKKKGLLINDLRKGWWSFYDSLGNKYRKSEYVIIRDSMYKNQDLFYDVNRKIKEKESTFFNIIEDTISLGKNKVRIKYNSNFHDAYNKYVYVYIENEYSDYESKIDTFTDDIDKLWFGVYAYKTGMKKIKGIIDEQVIYLKRKENDSFNLEVVSHKKYFEKEVYVKDSIQP